MLPWIPILVIVVIVLIVVLVIAGTYNGLIRSRNSVEEAFSTMDVYMKKRYDLIPNLVETVKGYAAHESGTLEKVTAARKMIGGAGSVGERMDGENQLTTALRSLFAVAESYPELKADTNFLDLQNQLKRVEEDIANSRKYYNGTVKQYNNKVMMFPSNLIAGMFHFTKKDMYEVSHARERENVQVKF